ncbi:MAG: hypothetical protein PUC97_03940 [bacterium]|nr:hypothetical protein [bacterium]
MSKFKEANKKIEAAVTGGYKAIEDGVVSGYKKVEDKFIDTFLAEEGETTEQAKERIMHQQKNNGGQAK